MTFERRLNGVHVIPRCKNNTVEVLDGLMGCKKTTGIIEWIESNPDERYIYVSPLLTEVCEGGRLDSALRKVSFSYPSDIDGTKSDNLLLLLKNGENIGCTHSLYLEMTDEHLCLIEKLGYTVIIDEEVNAVDGFSAYKRDDLKMLLAMNMITIDEHDGRVDWISKEFENMDTKYLDFAKYCNSESLYATKRDDAMMVTQIPIKLLKVSKRTIIITYLFDGNVLDCFLRLKGFNVIPFTEVSLDIPSKDKIRELITLITPNSKIEEYNMSSSWWSNSDKIKEKIKNVSNYIETNARKYNLKADDVAWTLPKSRAVKNGKTLLVKPKGYIKTKDGDGCFIPAMTRATNRYAHKKAMFHCYNRYPLVPVAAYFQDYGHPVNQELFALSEMLQWIWRGCIRNGEPMIVAIGSKRMYHIFKTWLDKDEV